MPSTETLNPGIWTIEPASALQDAADAWDALNRRTCNLPIMDAEFFRDSLAGFGSGSEVLAQCRVDDRVRAAAILEHSKPGVWTTYQPSQAPLGAWMAEDDADHIALMGRLQRALPGYCLLLGVSQQDPEYCPRPDAGLRLDTLDYIETACIDVSGSFSDYWSARGRNLRQNLKRQRNRLAREGVESRLEAVTDAASIGSAVDDYGILESRGWKSAKGTALHPENAQGKFYRTVFERLARHDEATVYRYWYGSRLVACDLCVHRNGVMIILKTTHDEETSKTSPTHLMRQEVFELLFNRGEIERIEFYGKLMDWHTKWSDNIRRMYHVNRLRWPVAGLIRAFSGNRR